MKIIKILLILVFSTTAVGGFELAMNNRGFEFGLNGKRNFKMLNSFEGYFISSKGWFELNGFKVTTSLQWLKLGKDVFDVNFLSGLYLVQFYYNENDIISHKSNSVTYGINIVDVETELKINKTGSVFIRGNLLNFNTKKFLSAGLFTPQKVVKDEIDKLVSFGIRLRFRRSEGMVQK